MSRDAGAGRVYAGRHRAGNMCICHVGSSGAFQTNVDADSHEGHDAEEERVETLDNRDTRRMSARQCTTNQTETRKTFS
jgi:hypothetical protein